MIFDHYAKAEPIVRRLSYHSYLLRALGNVTVTSQAEAQNHDSSGIPYFIPNTLT